MAKFILNSFKYFKFNLIKIVFYFVKLIKLKKMFLVLLLSIICVFLPSGSGGKPFGDNERDKWYVLGAVAAVAFLATVTMVEMGYKEIGWKEFVHRYE